MSPFSYFEVTCLATELNRMGSRDVFLTTELLLNWHCILKHSGHDMGHNGQRGQLMHVYTQRQVNFKWNFYSHFSVIPVQSFHVISLDYLNLASGYVQLQEYSWFCTN